MKLLFTALLCLLLAGCSGTDSHSAAPAEALQMTREAADSLQRRYGNAVEAIPLPLENVQQLQRIGASYLLQDQQELVILNEDFQPTASRTLEFIPQTAVSGQIFSAFDLSSRQLLLLTASLEESRRIILPPELSGSPFVGSSGNSVYYCTGSGIYCWDLESGIRRRIRESEYENQILVGMHRDDTVLQCRIREDSKEWDLFVDSQSGHLLQEMAVPANLVTAGEHYYCSFSSGSVNNLVFGSDPDSPRGLFPASLSGETVFLPESHTAVTAELTAENTYTITCYSLENGYLQDTLLLSHKPDAILEDGKGNVLLLVSENGQKVLLKWTPKTGSTGGKDYTDGYFTADRPDHAGLTLCRKLAGELSDKYGLEILIWKDAAATEPWDYTFEAEHRYPVLLSQLQTIDACLSRYPKELLSQTASHFSSLKFCLVQSITGISGKESLSTATGIQFLNGSDAYVVLAAGAHLEQALYHELFHVMESHILSCSNALDRWNELNPAGFSYDLDLGSNARRNSGVYLEKEGRAFVDTYSMSFPKEDRARIFEYSMLPDMEHLFRPEIMQQKLRAICTGIREAYGLQKHAETFPWEYYLEK